jgi:hypothetical protein
MSIVLSDPALDLLDPPAAELPPADPPEPAAAADAPTPPVGMKFYSLTESDSMPSFQPLDTRLGLRARVHESQRTAWRKSITDAAEAETRRWRERFDQEAAALSEAVEVRRLETLAAGYGNPALSAELARLQQAITEQARRGELAVQEREQADGVSTQLRHRQSALAVVEKDLAGARERLQAARRQLAQQFRRRVGEEFGARKQKAREQIFAIEVDQPVRDYNAAALAGKALQEFLQREAGVAE